MRNLKRALSLALAAIMVIGMMVIGAGAVSLNDFPDKEEIVNQDAVSMLTTLGIIDGKDTGKFDPKGDVTRAEMAKMISVIMNKGADNNALYASVQTGLTDIGSSWAKGHINFCFSQNIIAGRGNNKFDPTANVTAAEAAKMLLVAAGYNPTTEGFTGASWAINTSAMASKLGIYDNFTKNTMDPLNRDDAALLIYNALDIEMIQKYEDGYAIAFGDHRTILSAMYGVIKVQGVVTANEWAALDNDKDSALKDGKTRIENPNGIFSTTTSTSVNANENVKISTFNVSTPVGVIGRNVTLYIKKATILADSVVYGSATINTLNDVVVTGSTKNVEDLAKDNKLTLDKYTEYYMNYKLTEKDTFNNNDTKTFTDSTKANIGRGVEVTLIDNNNDGVVDVALSVRKDFGQVASKKTDSLTISGYKTVDDDKVVGFADVANDDYVLVTQYGGRTYVEKPEVVTGQMASYNIKDKDNQYMIVDGEQYKDTVLNVVGSVTPTKFWVAGDMGCEKDGGVQFKSTYDFYLDNFGQIIAFKETEGTASNYALVLDSGWSAYALTSKGEVKVLLADNTEATYELNMSASAKNFGDDTNTATGGMPRLKTYLGSNTVNDGNPGNAAGTLITYTLNDDNIMTIAPAKLNISSKAVADDGTNFGTVASLTKVLSRGDTYFQVAEATSYMTNKNRTTAINMTGYNNVGIDAKTAVFYYDDATATGGKITYGVTTGYDAMTKTVALGTKIDAAMYNPNLATGDTAIKSTRVAKAMLVHAPSDFSSSNYVLVLSSHNRDNDYYYYTAVLETGKVVELKSEQNLNGASYNGVTSMIYSYSTNGKGITTFSNVFTPGDSRIYLKDIDDKTTVATVGADIGTPQVYFGDVYYDQYTKWVEVGGNGKSLAVKDPNLVYNTFDVEVGKDTEAKTTTFRNGQQAVLVGKDGVLKAGFIIEDVYKNYTPGTPGTTLGLKADFLGSNNIGIYNPNGSNTFDVNSAITDLLTTNGYTNIKFVGTNVTATKNSIEVTYATSAMYPVHAGDDVTIKYMVDTVAYTVLPGQVGYMITGRTTAVVYATTNAENVIVTPNATTMTAATTGTSTSTKVSSSSTGANAIAVPTSGQYVRAASQLGMTNVTATYGSPAVSVTHAHYVAVGTKLALAGTATTANNNLSAVKTGTSVAIVLDDVKTSTLTERASATYKMGNDNVTVSEAQSYSLNAGADVTITYEYDGIAKTLPPNTSVVVADGTKVTNIKYKTTNADAVIEANVSGVVQSGASDTTFDANGAKVSGTKSTAQASNITPNLGSNNLYVSAASTVTLTNVDAYVGGGRTSITTANYVVVGTPLELEGTTASTANMKITATPSSFVFTSNVMSTASVVAKATCSVGDANVTLAEVQYYKITVPATTSITNMANATVEWTVDGVAAPAGDYYVVAGKAAVATVKLGTTGFLTAKANSTLTGAGTVTPVAAITTPTNAPATGTVATVTGAVVTFPTTAVTYNTGVFTFTWTVAAADITSMTLVSDNT